MRNALYKTACLSLIILGVVHTLYFITTVLDPAPDVIEALSLMKKGVVPILGERTLRMYYDGYSLAMGLLLVSYGLLAMISPVSRKTIIISLLAALVAFIISIVYFHVLAYLLTGLAFVCYALSLLPVAEKARA